MREVPMYRDGGVVPSAASLVLDLAEGSHVEALFRRRRPHLRTRSHSVNFRTRSHSVNFRVASRASDRMSSREREALCGGIRPHLHRL